MTIHLNVKNPKQHGSNHINGTDDIPSSTSESKGLLPILSGESDEFLSGEGDWVQISTTPTNYNLTTNSVLTPAQTSGTIITNLGQTDPMDLTLPEPSANMYFTFAVATPDVPISFKTYEYTTYLNGVLLTSEESISIENPTISSAMRFYAILIDADNDDYAIVAESITGQWDGTTFVCAIWNDNFNYSDGPADDTIWDNPEGSALRISSNLLVADESLYPLKPKRLRHKYETNGYFDIAVDNVIETSQVGNGFIGILLSDSPVLNRGADDIIFFMTVQYTVGSPLLYTGMLFGPHGTDGHTVTDGDIIAFGGQISYASGNVSIRLKRISDTIYGYVKVSGENFPVGWQLVGSYTGPEVLLPRYIGLCQADYVFTNFENFRFLSFCPGSYERVEPDITETFWEASDEYAEWTSIHDLNGWGAYDNVPGGFVSIAPVGDWPIDYRPTTVTIRLHDYCYQFKLLDTDGNIIASTADIRYEEGVVDLGDNNKWGVTLPITWQGYDIASAQIGDGLYGILYYIEFGPAVPTLNAVSPDYWHPADTKVLWKPTGVTEVDGWGCNCLTADTDGWLQITPIGTWPDGYRPSYVTIGTYDEVNSITLLDTTGTEIAIVNDITAFGTDMTCTEADCWEITVPIDWNDDDVSIAKFATKGSTTNTGVLYKLDFLDSAPPSTIPGLYIIYDQTKILARWDFDSTSIVQVAGDVPPGSFDTFETILYTNNQLFIGTDFGALAKWDGDDGWITLAPPYGTEEDISDICMYRGELYGGTWPNGKLYKWNGTDSWTEVAGNISEDIYYINNLFVYNDEIYGTGWWDSGQLIKWNGTDAWEIKTTLDLATADAITDVVIFENEIYAVSGADTTLLKWDGTNAWTIVAASYTGDEVIPCLAVFNGKIYAGTWDDGFLLEWNGTNAWVKVADTLDSNWYIYRLFVHDNELYGVAGDPDVILKWNGTDAWEYVASDGVGNTNGAWKIALAE